MLRRLERSGVRSGADAASTLHKLLRLDIALFRFAPFAGRVWELRHNLTACDAWYVAVAEAHGGRLATLDRRLARAAGSTCEIVVAPDAE